MFRVVPLFHHCSGVFLCSAGVPYSVVPRCSAGVLYSSVPGFTVCLLFLLYLNVHKKNSLFKILLWREIDNITFCFLTSLVKIWSEDSILIPIPIHPVLFWGRGRSSSREVGTDEQPVFDKPPLIRCGETYSTWRLWFKFKFFKGTSKSFVLKRWKKNVLHFVLLNYIAKVSPKSSGEGWLYWHSEVRSLLSKLIFTHIVSCWIRSHEIVDYHQTLKGRVASRISERFKAQDLSKISGFYWLNDSLTRWIWTLTRRFELVVVDLNS